MTDIQGITRPHPRLLVQYFAWSMATLIGFPFVFIPLLFRYITLRYRFDAEGVSIRWGVLFRREISLTYSRIQDIHVSRGIIERWLGLASLSIQTASGNAGAEIVLQGLQDYEDVRDWLYDRMRGSRHEDETDGDTGTEVLEILRDIQSDLAAIRAASARDAGGTA